MQDHNLKGLQRISTSSFMGFAFFAGAETPPKNPRYPPRHEGVCVGVIHANYILYMLTIFLYLLYMPHRGAPTAPTDPYITTYSGINVKGLWSLTNGENVVKLGGSKVTKRILGVTKCPKMPVLGNKTPAQSNKKWGFYGCFLTRSQVYAIKMPKNRVFFVTFECFFVTFEAFFVPDPCWKTVKKWSFRNTFFAIR